jgi:hypothetical protein
LGAVFTIIYGTSLFAHDVLIKLSVWGKGKIFLYLIKHHGVKKNEEWRCICTHSRLRRWIGVYLESSLRHFMPGRGLKLVICWEPGWALRPVHTLWRSNEVLALVGSDPAFLESPAHNHYHGFRNRPRIFMEPWWYWICKPTRKQCVRPVSEKEVEAN